MNIAKHLGKFALVLGHLLASGLLGGGRDARLLPSRAEVSGSLTSETASALGTAKASGMELHGGARKLVCGLIFF